MYLVVLLFFGEIACTKEIRKKHLAIKYRRTTMYLINICAKISCPV